LLRNAKRRDHLAIAYQSLADSIPFMAQFNILSFSEAAMERFERLKAVKLKPDGSWLRRNSLAGRVAAHAAREDM
jgi:hypothetical protein